MRIGLGYDIHRLVPERPLILGGVTIPSETGPDAHSDGDALTHAIIDALLGAVALGNLGLLYPDSDPAYKDADSLELLHDTYTRVQRAGYEIINIDTNVILEEPKLNPHLGAIRARLAECLGISVDAISVKPRTNELVGPEGRGKAIRAEAVALLDRIASGG
jgi:2-C-methyl-D-erythritol 2,4-cyclodiphosphate synthase